MKKPPQPRRLFSVNRFEYIVNNVGVATGTPTALQFAAGNPYCGTNCALRAMGVPPPPYPPPYPRLPPNNHLGLFSTVGRGLAPAVFPGHRVVEGADPYGTRLPQVINLREGNRGFGG